LVGVKRGEAGNLSGGVDKVAVVRVSGAQSCEKLNSHEGISFASEDAQPIECVFEHDEIKCDGGREPGQFGIWRATAHQRSLR
jgi:hypothetical protein